MTRKLKAGFAAVAVLALGAIGASGASAHYVFTPGTSPAVLTGTQIGGKAENFLEITSRGTKIACANASYIATTEGAEVPEVKVHATLGGGCEGGGLPATIDTKGCDYLLTGETDSEEHGKMHIICNTGKAIEITIPSINCTLKVHEQTPTEGGLKYNNIAGNPGDIEAIVTVKGITYERVGNGVLCMAAFPSEGNDADLTGKATIKSFEDRGCTGNLTEETLSCSEGAQVAPKVDS